MVRYITKITAEINLNLFTFTLKNQIKVSLCIFKYMTKILFENISVFVVLPCKLYSLTIKQKSFHLADIKRHS